MATIVNTMERRISNSKKQNQIIRILFKSFLAGVVGYFIFILTLVGGFHLISNLFMMGSTEINGTILIFPSIGYLAIYSILIIREMRINNFCK